MAERVETHPEHHERRLWLSVLGGSVVWFIHLMLVYPLTSLNCRWALFPWSLAGLSGLKVVQIVATIVALALVAWLIALAYSEWQWTREDVSNLKPGEFEERAARRPFLAVVAMLLNGLFFLTIALAIVPVMMIKQCA